MLRGKRRDYFWGKRSVGFAIEETRDVINDSLKVIGRFVELPDALVHTGLIVQRSNDEGAIDSPSTSCSILKHTLSLIQIHNSLIKQLLGDALTSSLI